MARWTKLKSGDWGVQLAHGSQAQTGDIVKVRKASGQTAPIKLGPFCGIKTFRRIEYRVFAVFGKLASLPVGGKPARKPARHNPSMAAAARERAARERARQDALRVRQRQARAALLARVAEKRAARERVALEAAALAAKMAAPVIPSYDASVERFKRLDLSDSAPVVHSDSEFDASVERFKRLDLD